MRSRTTSRVHLSPRRSSVPAMGQPDLRAAGGRAFFFAIGRSLSSYLQIASLGATVRRVACISQVTLEEVRIMTTPVAAKALIAELEQEAASTRKLLERVPADKLAWRPHERSMTIGQLAQHV